MTANKLHFPTKYSEKAGAAIINYLETVPQHLVDLRSLWGDEEIIEPPRKGERSFLETVAHLINCEARAHEALLSALAANEPRIVKIHPERAYGKLLRFEQLPIDPLLDYFKTRRVVLISLLRRLNSKQWERTIEEEGKKRRESVYLLARTMALHEAEHVKEWFDLKKVDND